MQNFKHELRWRSQQLANLFITNGIRGRYGLAKRLNVPKSTVHRAFGPDWSGVATHNMVAAIAAEFGVPVGYLVEVVERQAAA
ncbi:transcriptional repressor [Mycobacterium phage Shandong1]|uniref:HTH DNA binding protein n=1 Tax=Mycobacterium phage Shandong1 TaxID=1983447 RepID=A0A1X9SHF3_9CAUD|nr:transcriptional repressor [Mycobacterium phage Shandong1]ARQ95488.1 HTH DNA binding protein [Mycobacterium phage Shandong1]